MARTDNLTNFLTDVADSIREKKGTTESIKASDFDTEIESISGGGELIKINTVVVSQTLSPYTPQEVVHNFIPNYDTNKIYIITVKNNLLQYGGRCLFTFLGVYLGERYDNAQGTVISAISSPTGQWRLNVGAELTVYELSQEVF